MSTIARNQMSPATYVVEVLGCKVNQYEAQQIRQGLEADGLQPAPAGSMAEVVVVHSCAVTSAAVKKTRQCVRRLHLAHPEARVFVTGCAAGEELLEGLETEGRRIAPRRGWLGELQAAVGHSLPSSAPPRDEEEFGLSRFEGHCRAFLKVQDGCDLGCAFCIVPRLRRKPRDKPVSLVLDEARRLAYGGHREIVVSGVSVGLYGRDGTGPGLAGLLRELLRLPEVERVRLSSLHPNELTDSLLGVWADSPKMMPHLHLPLQAGSDRILAAMARNYTAAEFLSAIERVRAVLPQPAFTTDVITGFPGETDADFEQTEMVVRAAGFSRLHVFPYSLRPHTRAERLPDRVSSAMARARARMLQEVGRELSLRYNQTWEGRTARVLAEDYRVKTRHYTGYTERYVPVRFTGPQGLRGAVVDVRLLRAEAAYVEAERCDRESGSEAIRRR